MSDSPRLALARLAREVALADPGVATLDAGSSRLRATSGAGERIDGVVAAATAQGGYTVDLHVGAVPEDLLAMGDRVRGAVALAAAERGLAGELASVSVHVEDVVEP
jgi:hypothetical protein